MRLLPASFLLSVFGLTVAQDRSQSLAAVKQAFDQAHIPEDIALIFEPKVLLEVVFPQVDSQPITLYPGVQLERNETAGPPDFNVVGEYSSGPFVVAIIDPDAPTPQNRTFSQIRHFLGGSFCKMSAVDPFYLSNSTTAITEFLRPDPPARSDAHRYIFLLFEQSKTFETQTLVTADTPLTLFNLSRFAQEAGLGQPIGGTFMLLGPNHSESTREV